MYKYQPSDPSYLHGEGKTSTYTGASFSIVNSITKFYTYPMTKVAELLEWLGLA